MFDYQRLNTKYACNNSGLCTKTTCFEPHFDVLKWYFRRVKLAKTTCRVDKLNE